MGEFRREISFEPAYDWRDKNGGIHGVNLRFLLTGPEGAVQFVLYTNWQLPEVMKELEARPNHSLCHPMPADLGYHSPVPRYVGQEIMTIDCECLGGKPCYYDGSSFNARPVYERLLREGDAGVWAALEDYYKETFTKGEGDD